MTTQLQLLRVRRFLPLFGSQLLGAFNDNLFKSAFVMMVTFGAEMRRGHDPGALAALAGAALIAPFFVFSATAGELADRFYRSALLRILKAAEIGIVLVACAALLTQSLALSLTTLEIDSFRFAPTENTSLPALDTLSLHISKFLVVAEVAVVDLLLTALDPQALRKLKIECYDLPQT